MSDDGVYGLVLSFDSDHAEFARGFEAAAVYCDARFFASGAQVYEDDPDGEFRALVHIANAEMVLRIADEHGLHVVGEEVDDTWLAVTFTRTPPDPTCLDAGR